MLTAIISGLSFVFWTLLTFPFILDVWSSVKHYRFLDHFSKRQTTNEKIRNMKEKWSKGFENDGKVKINRGQQTLLDLWKTSPWGDINETEGQTWSSSLSRGKGNAASIFFHAFPRDGKHGKEIEAYLWFLLLYLFQSLIFAPAIQLPENDSEIHRSDMKIDPAGAFMSILVISSSDVS